MLFEKNIENWEDWGNVFQSIPAFEKLIEEICRREGIHGKRKIENVTPGTNAVFKVGEYIFKIFVPHESGYDSKKDYIQESEAMKRAGADGVKIPRIIANGEFEDKYLFRYIIMEYISGEECGKVLENSSGEQRADIVRSLRENIRKINKKAEAIHPVDFVDKFKNNHKWNIINENLREEIQKEIESMKEEEMFFVHGDITAENAIVGEDGELYIIDYADSSIAPRKYEYPPVVFDMLGCDRRLIEIFCDGMEYDEFVEKTFEGVLIHEFGAFILRDLLAEKTDVSLEDIKDLEQLKNIIFKIIKKGF